MFWNYPMQTGFFNQLPMNQFFPHEYAQRIPRFFVDKPFLMDKPFFDKPFLPIQDLNRFGYNYNPLFEGMWREPNLYGTTFVPNEIPRIPFAHDKMVPWMNIPRFIDKPFGFTPFMGQFYPEVKNPFFF